MVRLMGVSRIVNQSFLNELNSTGCKRFETVPYQDRQWMCGTYNVFNVPDPIFGAGFMCPESCGCYYDYGADPVVPEGFVKYYPGDPGMCPTRSCSERYADSCRLVNGTHCDGDDVESR
mmetsp:Transcript_162219/g.287440  ORF Transcript_162219/g.287440 Transcript_162219/m.287440 type:complete len:119 (+) Transcript_162219:1-357(+)